MQIQIMPFWKRECNCSAYACVDLGPPHVSVWETCPEVRWLHKSVKLKDSLSLGPVLTLGSIWFRSAEADLWFISIKPHFFPQSCGKEVLLLSNLKNPLDILISKLLTCFPTMKRSQGLLLVNAFIPVLQTSRYCDHEYWIEYEEHKSLTLALNSHASQLEYVWLLKSVSSIFHMY